MLEARNGIFTALETGNMLQENVQTGLRFQGIGRLPEKIDQFVGKGG